MAEFDFTAVFLVFLVLVEVEVVAGFLAVLDLFDLLVVAIESSSTSRLVSSLSFILSL